MLKNKPEVLAPCGNRQSLTAAVAAGADACYLAGNSFGARAFAGNFSADELIDAIEYAHIHGVKIYLTVNTLVKDNELGRVVELLNPLYEHGLDAVLVQDFGVMRLIRDTFPELPIHTSTQMNILTPEGALLAKSAGASRIVAAREMTLDELARIRTDAEIEVEAFVHGAMCVCFSGRCLMSSMAGGRSGNRGCCAQPCRKMYDGSFGLSMKDMCTIRFIPELVKAGIDSLKIEGRMKNEYYVAATVDSYRRMIDSYFEGKYSQEKAIVEEKRLLDIFNRGGFTSGYLMLDRDLRTKERETRLIDDKMPGRRGVLVGKISSVKNGNVFFKCQEDIGKGDELLIEGSQSLQITSGKAIKASSDASLPAPNTRSIRPGDCIYRTRNKSISEEIGNLIEAGRPVKADMKMKIRAGEKMRLEISCGETLVSCEGPEAEVASSRPVDIETVKDKLVKTGDKDFYIDDAAIDMDGNVFVPASSLKKLRREALEELRKKMVASYFRNPVFPDGLKEDSEYEAYLQSKYTAEMCGENKKAIDSGVHVVVNSRAQLETVMRLNPDMIYLDMGVEDKCSELLNSYETSNASNSGADIVIMLPYIDRDVEKTRDIIKGLSDKVSGFYIRCYDDLAMVLSYLRDSKVSGGNVKKYKIILAHSLYAYNCLAVKELVGFLEGTDSELFFESPIELSKAKSDAIYYPEHVSVVRMVYGRPELMITDALSARDKTLHGEKGSEYLVKYSELNRYSVIFDSKPISLHNASGIEEIRLFRFMDESSDEIYDIMTGGKNLFSGKTGDRSSGKKGIRYTTGHYEKGI